MKTLAGDIVTFEVSLLTSATVTPPAGAGVDNVTVNTADCPGATVTPAGNPREPAPTVASMEPDDQVGAEAVIVADPPLMPVTCTGVTDVVDPAGMTMLAGDTVTFEPSLVDNETVVVDGAAFDKVTGTITVCPIVRATLAGIPMDPTLVTLMVALVSGTLGRALAWIKVAPPPTPVTGTGTLVAAAEKVTVGGTVAMLGLSELRLTVRPDSGAGAERFNVRFCVAPPLRLKLVGEKLRVAGTFTVWVADTKPGAEAVMFAAPMLLPVTCGCETGTVALYGTKTDGVTLTIEELLLVSVMVVPPGGAGEGRFTVNTTDWLSGTDTFAGIPIWPNARMFTFRAVSARLGRALA